MPIITVTKNYADNTTLTQSQLDTAFSSIETFLNTTKIDATNIQNGAVGNSQLAASSVGQSQLASNSVFLSALASEVNAKLVPTGAVHVFAGTSAPTGYLMCDGSAVSRSTYAALYGIIGTAHGHGDGSTTFNLPDYRGRFIRGVDGGAGRDPDTGSRTAMNSGGNTGDALGSIQSDDYANHNHPLTDPGHTHDLTASVAAASGGAVTAIGGGTLGNVIGVETTGISISAQGGNETRPLNAYVNFIIKV